MMFDWIFPDCVLPTRKKFSCIEGYSKTKTLLKSGGSGIGNGVLNETRYSEFFEGVLNHTGTRLRRVSLPLERPPKSETQFDVKFIVPVIWNYP